MHRTLIVGHDGSPNAERARRLAEQLADDGATLVLARVVPARVLDRATLDLAAVRPGDREGLRVSVRALSGRSVEHALAALAEEEDADLIVVGSHRRPGDYRAHNVLGLRLLRDAPCGVAIAPAEDELEIRRIGVAYDGSAEAELALEAAYELAARLHAAVSLYLAVLPDPSPGLGPALAHREANALLDAAAERAPAGVNPETVVLSGYASAALASRAGGIVDLLVVGSRRQGPLRRALVGSTSRALAVEVPCSVLVTPRGSRRRVAVA
jgi:nucleotide-binding universal stress UspA family protein